MVVPSSVIVNTFGDSGAFVMMVVRPIFSLLSIVFIALAIVYIRNLVQTKCQCSEDVRREVLYIYYIIEIVLISFGVVIFLLESVVLGAVALGVSTTRKLGNSAHNIADTISNPIKSLKKLPASFNKVTKSLPASVNKVTASLKKTLRKK
jgi:hypothetical protein